MDTKSAFSRIVFTVMVSITIAFSGQIYPVSAESSPPEGWVETNFVEYPGLYEPLYWNPAPGGETAICWSNYYSGTLLGVIRVYGPEDVGEELLGDACRMFLHGTWPTSGEIEALATWWWGVLGQRYSMKDWFVLYVNGNEPPYEPPSPPTMPEGWSETRFVIGPSGFWDPVNGEVSLCWGSSPERFLTVFGPEDVGEVLHGDACRMFEYPVPSPENIEQLTIWWQYSLISEYGSPWPITFFNGNTPPYVETFLPLIFR